MLSGSFPVLRRWHGQQWSWDRGFNRKIASERRSSSSTVRLRLGASRDPQAKRAGARLKNGHKPSSRNKRYRLGLPRLIDDLTTGLVSTRMQAPEASWISGPDRGYRVERTAQAVRITLQALCGADGIPVD